MTSENIEYLFDTYAWIEYFLGSNQGNIVNSLLESHNIYTSIISIAELADKYVREGLEDEWEARLKFIINKSNILYLSLEIARNAGSRKWKLREENKEIGLTDAIKIETGI